MGYAHLGPPQPFPSHHTLTFIFPPYIAFAFFHKPLHAHPGDAVVGVGQDFVDVGGTGEGDGGHDGVGFVAFVGGGCGFGGVVGEGGGEFGGEEGDAARAEGAGKVFCGEAEDAGDEVEDGVDVCCGWEGVEVSGWMYRLMKGER